MYRESNWVSVWDGVGGGGPCPGISVEEVFSVQGVVSVQGVSVWGSLSGESLSRVSLSRVWPLSRVWSLSRMWPLSRGSMSR